MSTPRDADLRIRGLGLRARFALTMAGALALVMGIASYSLYSASSRITAASLDDTLARALVLSAKEPAYEQAGGAAREHRETGVQIFSVNYGAGLSQRGLVFQLPPKAGKEPDRLFVPDTGRQSNALFGMILAVMLSVVVVGLGVALWVANQVSSPIEGIVQDIRQIAKGDLSHRTRARGGGAEIELLARSIDRMTRDLEAAQEAELELSIRDRERELAGGVREALLPVATPLVSGYDLGAAHLASAELGGDFHDWVELSDGRVGLLVCDVSGQGVPAALIGATARAYLRKELSAGGDVAEAFKRVNREIARDVRRGMFVTALYLLLDAESGRAQLACAGHKMPLIRFDAAERKLRLVHPEGIALGFDKGPVFDRALQLTELEIAPGDRLTLSNSGPLAIVAEDGTNLDEKSFFKMVLRHSGQPTPKFLRGLRQGLEEYGGSETLSADVSLVTISREA